jgi:hypothetical protein
MLFCFTNLNFAFMYYRSILGASKLKKKKKSQSRNSCQDPRNNILKNGSTKWLSFRCDFAIRFASYVSKFFHVYHERSSWHCRGPQRPQKWTKSESKSIFSVVASRKGLVVMSLHRLKWETKKIWTRWSSWILKLGACTPSTGLGARNDPKNEPRASQSLFFPLWLHERG